MELVDVADSKSADGNIMWVRVPPPAPKKHPNGVLFVYSFFSEAGRVLMLRAASSFSARKRNSRVS